MSTLRTPTQAPLRRVTAFATASVRPVCAPLPLLPLFQRPARVALVSEDPCLVDRLGRSLPRRWGVRPFTCATRALYALQQEPPAWDADLWAQQDLLAHWRAGAPLIPLVLRYWAQSPRRRALTSVAVADAHMAGLGGLDLLGELVGWQGQRVLLAGAFDADGAQVAFEEGQIDRFVLRRDHSLRADLVRVVDALLARPGLRHEAMWASTLLPHQLDALGRPGVAGDLHALLQQHWVEWIVLGEPFGVLGLDAGGRAHWLQLARAADLEALAERAGAAGLPPAAVQQVLSGRRLANIDLRDMLGLPGCDLLPARRLGGPDGLLAASTRIDLVSGMAPRAGAGWRRLLRASLSHSVFAIP